MSQFLLIKLLLFFEIFLLKLYFLKLDKMYKLNQKTNANLFILLNTFPSSISQSSNISLKCFPNIHFFIGIANEKSIFLLYEFSNILFCFSISLISLYLDSNPFKQFVKLF